MKFKLFSVVVIIILLMTAACQQTPSGNGFVDPVIPILTSSTGWVVDTTATLGVENERNMEALAEEIRTDGFQIGIAIFSNSASEPIQIATEFGNTNQIGSGEIDNGIAVAIFLDKEGASGDKPAIAVAIGSGLEAVLTDGITGRILDATYVPARSSGDWQRGTIELLTGLRDYLNGARGIDEFRTPPPPDQTALIVVVVIAVIIIVILDGIFLKFAIVNFVLELFLSASESTPYGSSGTGFGSSGSSGSSSTRSGGGGSFRGGGSTR